MAKKKIITPPGVKKIKTTSSQIKAEPGLPPNYKEGKKRPYFSTAITEKTINDTTLTKVDYIALALVTIGALYVRFTGVQTPKSIVFDEIHIVRHINDYLHGKFFLDITPPLGKLFYAFIARVLGYKGLTTNLVKPGQSFEGKGGFPYVDLRIVSSLLGSGTVGLGYLSLRNLGVRSTVAVFGSILIVLENSLIVSSRLFMPDSLSVFLLSLAIFAFTKFQVTAPFSKDWARYLVLTGLALGLGISTKWIAFSTIAWVGLLSLQQVWYLFGDLEITNGKITRHIFSRLSFLLISPIIIYFGTFAVHILLLNNVSNDSTLLSTHFQRSMSGNDIYDIPKYVTFGSTVTIRHQDSLGGFLHSHDYPYKSGSHNQQVTVFDYKDYNNEWIIEPENADIPRADNRIKKDTVIRLRHKNTGKLLRVDDFKPPISEQDYDSEVSCYGNHTYKGNETDLYFLKVESEDNAGAPTQFVEALNTKFRLWNRKKRCTIISHDLKLPEWGFHQQEVLCIESPNVERAIFYFETVKYDEKNTNYEAHPELKERLPTVKLSFWAKFFELNTKMIRVFQGINSSNKLATDAITWPFLTRGVQYFSSEGSIIYLIGNPIIWWLVIMLIPSYACVRFADLFRVDNAEDSVKYRNSALWLISGWALHYVPYLVNEGEFFTSYYQPSLYFGILLIGVTFEYITFKKEKLSKVLIVVTLLFAYYFYSTLIPITYGTAWDYDSCQSSKVVGSWDYNCDLYKKLD